MNKIINKRINNIPLIITPFKFEYGDGVTFSTYQYYYKNKQGKLKALETCIEICLINLNCFIDDYEITMETKHKRQVD